MAMAAIATGIILKVMDSPAGMGMFTTASTISTAISMAVRVILETLERLRILLMLPSVQAPLWDARRQNRIKRLPAFFPPSGAGAPGEKSAERLYYTGFYRIVKHNSNV